MYEFESDNPAKMSGNVAASINSESGSKYDYQLGLYQTREDT